MTLGAFPSLDQDRFSLWIAPVTLDQACHYSHNGCKKLLDRQTASDAFDNFPSASLHSSPASNRSLSFAHDDWRQNDLSNPHRPWVKSFNPCRMLDHKAQGSGRGRPLIGGLIRPIPIETADELFAYVEVLYG